MAANMLDVARSKRVRLELASPKKAYSILLLEKRRDLDARQARLQAVLNDSAPSPTEIVFLNFSTGWDHDADEAT